MAAYSLSHMCDESETDGLVGFRFKPTDEEIVCLLGKKRLDPEFSIHTIREINIYDFEPWELSGFSAIQSEEEVWYFYCEPYYKYAKSKRAHRRTKAGYWKITGKGSSMKSKNSREVIGTKRILSFCCLGTASKNANTKWVMHEISVEDDPLYQKDYVVCRLERKRVRKLGVSTIDEDQLSEDLASCSNIDTTKDIFSELSQLDKNMVSERNHVAENIFSKTVEFISHSRNQVAEIVGLDAEVLAGDNLISYPRNEVAECTSPEPINLVSERNHAAENIGLDSEVLVSDGLISYPRNDVAQDTFLESIQPPNQYLVSKRNHVAENTSLVSQVLPSAHLISYSRNCVAENICAESQLLPSHGLVSYSRNDAAENTAASDRLISYSRNRVAENTCTESQFLPSHGSVSYSTDDAAENTAASDQLISYCRNRVAENICAEFQLQRSHSLVSYSRDDAAENTAASDQLISCSRNRVAENICAESQLLPSHGLVSYSRNHAAEITAAKSQLLASQNLASYSKIHVAEIPLPESQQLANPNLISYSRNHAAENSSKELHPVPNYNLESLKLPNEHWISDSTNNVENIFEAEPRLFAEFNQHGGCDWLNNTSFLAQQSPYAEQELSYLNSSGCDLLISQFYSEQVDDLVSLLRAFQNESSCEEPGQTFTPHFNSSRSSESSLEASGLTYSPDFNSSMSDGGVHMENSGDMDTKALDAWVNELAELL